MLDLNHIDPDWAWHPYEPSTEDGWTIEKAAHLHRRAGFGASFKQLQEAAELSPEQAVEQLVTAADSAPSADNNDSGNLLFQTVLATGDSRQLAAAWVYRMLETSDPLLEKMTLFWHGHFATGAEKVRDAGLMWDQNQLLRRHALGDFGKLVHGISADPAMLVYLDSVTNRKAHPNENYARELMELFCLGEGNYTEEDIRQLAKCFTGWEVKRKKFRFNRYQHDFGTKSVLQQSGIESGEEAVDVVLDQPAMPRFIVAKLIRYLVFDEPHPTPALVQPLADAFRASGLQIRPLIKRILGSNLFYSDLAIGRKIRSPVEMGIGLLRAVNGRTNSFELAEWFSRLGQGLFFPPNVKGWDGGRAWINSSTLLGRANMIRDILESDKTSFSNRKVEQAATLLGSSRTEQQIERLEQTLFAVKIAETTRRDLIALAKRNDKKPGQKLIDLLHAICTLPEFQLA